MTDFNVNQFGTGGNKVVIKSGAALTNTAFTGTLTLNGGSFTNGGVTSGSVISVSTRAAMEALAGLVDGTPVILKGYYALGDIPQTTYTYVASDTSAVDNGSVITNASGRFKVKFDSGRVDIRNFGVIGDVLKIGGSWTNGSTNIVLASAPVTNYVGKKIALRRGNTSVAAEITATLGGGAVTSFTVVSNGQGYINVPTVILSAGPGSGGTFTPVLTAGQVTSVTVGGGGASYTASSVFKLRSTDCGTTNAPYYTELFTVLSQSSSNLTISAAPTFTANLNANDDPSEAYLYTDNVTNFQACIDYAYTNGMEVYIPGGDYATGPVYLNPGQKITGGGQDKAKIHSAAVIGFTTFRKSVFAPKNINTSNGRHSSDTLMPNVEISGFYLDGEGAYQSPMGTDLNNGLFAVFGINCIAVENWHIHDMLITNCQGGSIYLGSFSPVAGTSGDWSVVQSKYVKMDHVRHIGNWRQAHQLGNVRRSVSDTCDYIDSSLGYYYTQVSRNLTTGSSVGNNNTYSPEELDFEANSFALSGYNKFVNCWFQNQYGKAVDLYFDQPNTDFINCTFKDNLAGSVTASNPINATSQNNFDAGAEWTTFNQCRFFCSSTNFGLHLYIKGKGEKVVNCYFEGKTGNTTAGNADVVVDSSGYTAAPSYVLAGAVMKDNTFNLYPTDGTFIEGTIQITASTLNNLKNFKFDNVILAGAVDHRNGTDEPTRTVAKMAGIHSQEGYVYQTSSGGNPDFLSESTTAGFGSQDFTFAFRYSPNSSTTRNGELMRWTANSVTEFRIFDKWGAGASNCFQIDWNPSNVGSRSIFVPIYTARRESYSATEQYQRPCNVAVTKTHGSVYKFAVTAGGTGYTSAPTVTVASGAATGTAQISAAGVVTNIYITAAGSSYTTNPVVTLSGGGGSGATATASAGKMDVFLDDLLIYTDYGVDIITNMTTSAGNISINRQGNANKAYYSYAVWNKALTEDQLRQFYIYGPAEADKWGIPNSTLGCITYIKFNPGIGFWFEDLSSNNLHVWTGQATTHGVAKRTGQIKKRITTAAASTNSVNVALAASDAIPANARITSIYAVGQALGVPSVVVGFDASLANPITTAKTLAAGVTNYLPLVQAYLYGSTNRPVYISTSAASTNDYVINYTLDQGELSGPFLGFQDASSAAAGDIGETLTSAVAVTGAFNMATTVVTNVTSLSLTPGRWVVYGNANFTGTNSTITAMSAGITTTTATIPTDGTEQNSWVALTTTSFKNSIAVKPKAFTVSTTTPVYLVMVGTFSTANSVGAYGSMIAQRQ